jgi:hypothetical protein
MPYLHERGVAEVTLHKAITDPLTDKHGSRQTRSRIIGVYRKIGLRYGKKRSYKFFRGRPLQTSRRSEGDSKHLVVISVTHVSRISLHTRRFITIARDELVERSHYAVPRVCFNCAFVYQRAKR